MKTTLTKNVSSDNLNFTASLEIEHKNAWTQNCHGDQFTDVTTCSMFIDGEWVSKRVVRRHVLDSHDPSFAARLVASRILKSGRIPKKDRGMFWKEILSAYPPKKRKI